MLTRQLYKLIPMVLALTLLNLIFSLNTTQAQKAQVYANKRYLIVINVTTSPALVPLVIEFDGDGNLQFVASSLNPVVFDANAGGEQEIPQLKELVPTPFMQFGIQYHDVRKETLVYRAELDTDADGQADSKLRLQFSKDGSTLRGSFSSNGSDSIGPETIRTTIQGVVKENLRQSLPPVGFTRFVPLGKETDIGLSRVVCTGSDSAVCNIARRGDFVGYELCIWIPKHTHIYIEGTSDKHMSGSSVLYVFPGQQAHFIVYSGTGEYAR